MNIRHMRCSSHLAYCFPQTNQHCKCSVSVKSHATSNYSEELNGVMIED